MRLLLLGVLALAACSRKTGPDCGAIRSSLDRMRPAGAAPDAAAERVLAVFAQRCTEDKWSAGSLGCIAGARDEAAFKRCIGLELTAAQRDRLVQELAAAQGITSGELEATKRRVKEQVREELRQGVDVDSAANKARQQVRDELERAGSPAPDSR